MQAKAIAWVKDEIRKYNPSEPEIWMLIDTASRLFKVTPEVIRKGVLGY